MTFFYLLLVMCLSFEIHKMLDFSTFNHLNYINVKYKNELRNHTETTIYKNITKLVITNFVYFIIIVIGMFGAQSIFFVSMVWLWIIGDYIIKITKNKKLISTIYFSESFLSAIIIILSIINFFFFKMEVIEFLKYLIT